MMEKLTSILVVVDQREENSQLLAKALVLARHTGASLELFLCDAEHGYSLRRTYNARGVVEARTHCLANCRRFVESLRRSIAADDVKITTHVSCESPLYEGIVHRVLSSHPDLVIKSAGMRRQVEQELALDSTDWQLIRTCPATLMLTRGRPWRPRPRLAAAVDLSRADMPALTRVIAHTGEYLALACHGELELLFCEPGSESALERARHVHALSVLAQEFHVPAERVRSLSGQPESVLPEFAAQQGYDIFVMGALTHRRGFAALVGTLTHRVMDEFDCDFLLVKPDTFVCPVQALGDVSNA